VHEVTTSGAAHYDAADATPLWLRFVAQYLAWTGDLATVRAHWDQVRAAVAFVLSHDRDGDGLPENTGVGHGWVESGPLGGGAVTSYVAAIWIDALRRLGPMARAMGDANLAERVDAARVRAESSFESRLRAPVSGRVSLQLDASGTPVTELTALSAVPILLGVDRATTASDVVGELAGEDFCAPWGVRMLSRRDARYRPRGYHFGAVWPLFSGWGSLAAYACARAEDGWTLLGSIARGVDERARGAFDEVLDGDCGTTAGVCADQAWSAAMIISPFIYGMLGIRPSALEQRCVIDPQWPAAWPSAELTGIRVGASRFSLAMSRVASLGDPHEAYVLCLESGPPLTIELVGAASVCLANDGPATVRRPARSRGDHGQR
jgi:glycogen debranching enzyme